ncbi:MAG: nucleotidyltransferase domain-containing protein [Candidatus Sumerlaeia bacterium]|nr:nucleotidyltransferase domain-containing protein [Candidatus Sumerlaeia bacterium]
MNDVSETLLCEIIRRVSDAVSPKEVFLFGSHAWGTPTAGSDVDLFVVVSKSTMPMRAIKRKIRQRLRDIMVPIDLLVESDELFERRKQVVASLEKRISQSGRKLYG